MAAELMARRDAALQWLESTAAAELSPESRRNIRRWLELPACEPDWPALLQIIDSQDFPELTRLFWERIPFGTGGRRGPMSDFGTATINRRTIAESAWGLAQYVLAYRQEQGTTTSPRAVVAYDSRLRSPEFAEVTARVLAASGFHVDLYQQPRATPQLSFSVRHLACDCGVMISASHNPPADNGFKAYWCDGGQLLSPHDRGVITQVELASDIPIADLATAMEAQQIEWVSADVDQAYIAAVTALAYPPAGDVRILYTPLHGVGETSVAQVLLKAGFSQLELFEPQRSPDGRFPNVPDHLPNPERAAVFGPAIAAAEQAGHDIILASDPDADRIAVAVRTPQNRFACLTGNQLGALLADYAATQFAGKSPDHYFLHTLVTTPLISRIAEAAGFTAVADLPVGFKYIGAAMERMGAERLIFAAEESLGYLAGAYCRDKDAAVGALWCAELAARLKAQGHTLLDRLQQLYERFGWHRESQLSFTWPGPEGAARIARLIERFRTQPPVSLGEAAVDQIRDYGRQTLRNTRTGQITHKLPVNAGDLLFADVSWNDCEGQVALRPSGTEPKIKCYFFVQAAAHLPAPSGEQQSQDLLKELELGLQEWLEHA